MNYSTTEGELKTPSDFTQVYNKWFRELASIEDNLITKSTEVQVFQNTLHADAEKLTNLNGNIASLQEEQNYAEELLNVLTKEQDELEKEIIKLNENTAISEEVETEYLGESSDTLEFIDAELKSIKESIKKLVVKINDQGEKYAISKSPFPTYRTILDHYADALSMMDKNITELQHQFDTLSDIRLWNTFHPICSSPY